MQNVIQKDFIYVLIAITLCSLVYTTPISVYAFTLEQYNFQPNLQDDTVFGNFSSQHTHTFYERCDPSVFIDVSDSDGIDSVWLTYRRSNETAVLNQSMSISSSFDLNRYVGYFTVYVSQAVTEFVIQFHANDSLGHQSSSDEYTLVILYNPDDPTGNGSIDSYLIIGLSIVIVLLVVFFILWRKDMIG